MMKKFHPMINQVFRPLRKLQAVTIVFSVGVLLFKFMLYMEIQKTVDSISWNDLGVTMGYLKGCALLIVLFFGANCMMQYFFRSLQYTSHYALVGRLFGLALEKDCSFHEKNAPPVVLGMIKDDSKFISDWKSIGTITVFFNSMTLAAVLGILIRYHALIALFILLAVMLCFFLTYRISKEIGKQTYDLQVANSEANQQIIDDLNGFRDIRQYRKGIGMIFQHFALLERQNVYKNIAAPMECWRYPKESMDAKVRELAQIVGIEDKLYEKPRNLSGGQRQRVAIARALALEPEILLSDEATSALDPKTTKAILQLLRNINERLGITILLVTHEMEVIRSICHRVAVMEDGRIADCGEVSEIFLNQPDSLKRLLGDESEVLPEDGVNLRIIFKETPENRSLIPDITTATMAKFSVLYSRLEKFRDEVICTAMLNVGQRDFYKIESYLDSLQVKWEVVEHE